MSVVPQQGWFTWSWLYDWVAEHVSDRSNVPTFVEVGVWKGTSLAYLCQTLQKHRAKPFRVVAVDTWSMDVEYGPESNALNHYINSLKAKQQSLYDVYDRYLRDLGIRHLVTDMRMTSLEAADLIPYADFVFIDADHSAEAVEADVQAWNPKTPLLAGHDIGQPSVCRGLINALGAGQFYVLPLINCWTVHKPLADVWMDRLHETCIKVRDHMKGLTDGEEIVTIGDPKP